MSMPLTEEQRESVRQWAAGGASLSDIQSRLHEEFSVRMNYMDVRLLVLELDVQIRDKKTKEAPRTAPENAATDQEPAATDDAMAGEDAGTDPLDGETAGGVRLEVSRIAQPGFALHGDVTFSDGVRAPWGITARGELSLAAADPSYRPSEEDIRDFQLKLRDAISGQGF